MNIPYAADRIYTLFYGHLDDAPFHDTKLTEITDWLVTGDLKGATLKSLYDLWAEYDAKDIADNPKDPAAVSLGKRGGASTSPAKRAASAANGAKGGRPRKVTP